jgi:hypothetical protein
MEDVEAGAKSRVRVPYGAIAWVLASAIIEGLIGAHLARVGRAAFGDIPSLWDFYVLVGCAAALCVLGALASRWWSRRLRRDEASAYVSQWAIFAGSVAVGVLALVWTAEWVVPLRVASLNVRLVQLARCAQRVEASCPNSTSLDVPGLGHVARGDVIVSHDREEVLFLTGPANGTYGYLYAPAATTTRSLGVPGYGRPGYGDSCVRHVYGPWWEYENAQLNSGCNPGWGWSFILDGGA